MVLPLRHLSVAELRWEDLEVGRSVAIERVFSAADLDVFRQISRDVNPLHMDDDFARKRGYQGAVVFGMLTSTLLTEMVGVYLPGLNGVLTQINVQFPNPLYLEQKVGLKGVITHRHEATRTITIKVEARRLEDAQVVLRGIVSVLLREQRGNGHD